MSSRRDLLCDRSRFRGLLREPYTANRFLAAWHAERTQVLQRALPELPGPSEPKCCLWHAPIMMLISASSAGFSVQSSRSTSIDSAEHLLGPHHTYYCILCPLYRRRFRWPSDFAGVNDDAAIRRGTLFLGTAKLGPPCPFSKLQSVCIHGAALW